MSYYDIDGRPIGPSQGARLIGDVDARRVAFSSVEGWRLSTVHIVLDHRFGPGPPLIFETMLFPPPGTDLPDELPECERTSNRHAALAMHDQLLARLHDYLEANP